MALWPSTSFQLLAAAALLMPAAAHASQDPLEVIRTSNQKILDLYAADSGEADSQVDQQVFDVMDKVTSFSRIASLAIDRFCDAPQSARCMEFKDVFIHLLRVSSVRKLGRYRADRFDYQAEKVDGNTAVVPTLAYYGDDEIELVYQLGLFDEHWLIINYVVDGVDTVRNYRKQFTRMLRKGTIDSVIRRLRRRIEQIKKEDE